MHAQRPDRGDVARPGSTVNSAPEADTASSVGPGPGSGSLGSVGQVRSAVLPGGKIVLGPDEISRALTRVAHEILERTNGASDVILLGIPTRGVPLASRLAARLAQAEGRPAASGSLDITMYRDDLRLRPARPLGHTAVPSTGIDGKIVVLVDDVLYSGRTVRAALDALGDLGRPRAVQLAVLVDRGHRELPIRPDYVGKNLPTSQSEVVQVLLTETDGQDAVVLGAGGEDKSRPAEMARPHEMPPHTAGTAGGLGATGAGR
jgi:pyrimidine operon attenuation protein/uracil phosphoribosyltransferase